MFTTRLVKSRALVAAVLLGAALSVHADTASVSAPVTGVAAPVSTVPATETPSKAGEAKKLLRLLGMQTVCALKIDLTMQNASVEDIAARVQTLLPQPAPKIEVRGVRPVQLSFALKNSKVGEALNSAASFGNAQLWMFSDYLLLAPETALSEEEHKETSTWEQRNGWPGSLTFSMGVEMQKAFTNFISEELKAKTPLQSADKTAAPAITMGQLSPDSQAMLQWLVGKTDREYARVEARFPGPPLGRVALSPGTVVEMDSKHFLARVPGFPPSVLKASDSSNPPHEMVWSLNGVGGFIGTGERKPETPTTPTAPPVLDPSAGQS